MFEQVNFISPIRDAVVMNIKDLVASDVDFLDSESVLFDDFKLDSFYPYSLTFINPNESLASAFIISLSKESSLIPNRSIGYPEVTWSSALGESGVIRGIDAMSNNSANNHALLNTGGVSISNQQLQNSSLVESKNVKIVCISSPSYGVIGQPFTIKVRITNNTKQNLKLKLLSHSSSQLSVSPNNQTSPLIDSGNISPNDNPNHENSQALYIIDSASINLGVVQVNTSIEKTLSLYPVSAGLHELKNIVIIDSSGREYSSGSLFKVMVYRSDIQ